MVSVFSKIRKPRNIQIKLVTWAHLESHKQAHCDRFHFVLNKSKELRKNKDDLYQLVCVNSLTLSFCSKGCLHRSSDHRSPDPRQIRTSYSTSRRYRPQTTTHVASHAEKHFLRQTNLARRSATPPSSTTRRGGAHLL